MLVVQRWYGKESHLEAFKRPGDIGSEIRDGHFHSRWTGNVDILSP